MISEDAEVRRGPRSTAGSADAGYFSSKMSSIARPVEYAVDHKGQPLYPREACLPQESAQCQCIIRTSGTESLRTLCWREPDSNFRYLAQGAALSELI
jgi:hypothetical protein